MNLRFTFLVLITMCVGIFSSFAQSGEDCDNAIPISYIASGACDTLDNVGASTDVTGVNFNTFGLSCNPQDNEVWFEFVATPPLFDLVISVNGIDDNGLPAMVQPQLSVLVGSCLADTFEIADCSEALAGSNSTSITIPAASQIPGFTYYIMVSDWSASAAPNEGAFQICLEELQEITAPPNGGGPYTSCSGIIHDTGGPNGSYSANESYTFDICPTESFSCLALDITYDTEPISDEIEITGFVPDVANPVVLTTLSGVNADGVTILSTGCVTVSFESDGNTQEAGYTIEWNCVPDECYSDEAIIDLLVNQATPLDTICQGVCVGLTANPTPINETTDYSVSQVPYNPFPFIGNNEITVPSDDAWSDAIALPFDFCFYGNSYSQVVVGTNGVVSFDVFTGGDDGDGYANDFNNWNITQGIPGNQDILNSITSPFHDINPAAGGAIYYSIYGTAPFRVAVFSFNNVNAFSCQVTSTQQIAIYESTNIIETYISNKILCTSWNGGAAIHGIQNALGTQAVVVPGRNFPDLWTASNDAWRFTPSGVNQVPITIDWYDSDNNLVGTGAFLEEVCPSETEVYRAEVTYDDLLCSNTTFSIADSLQIVVEVDGTFTYDIADSLVNICTGESVPIGGTATAGVTYTWTPTTGLDLTDPANPIASPSTTTTYTIFMDNGFCQYTDSVTVQVLADPSPTITGVLEICPGGTTTLDAGGGYTSYSWSTGETTQTATADALGDYTVTVTLASGCVGSSTITVGPSAGMSAQVVGTTTNTCDNPNGSIDTETLTGIAPFSYNWTGDAAGQGADPINIPAGTYTATITDAAGCTTTLEATVTQQDPVVASVDEDTVCIGELVQLNAVGGNGTYSWTTSNGSEVSDENIPNPTANPTTTTTYYATSETNTGNLVVNGDFEAGDTGFSSNYVIGLGGSFGDLSNPGTYGIYTSPDQGHTNFVACGDHTSGTGNMMVVNGAGFPDLNVWCQTITVEPGIDYNFSAWFTSVEVGSPAQLQFEINGTQLGDIFELSADNTCSWDNFNTIWNSGSSTSATICIINQNTTDAGNDFAIDDITFTQYCDQVDSVTVYVSEPVTAVDQDNTSDDFCGSGQGIISVETTGGFGPYTYTWSPNANGQTTATITDLVGDQAYFVTATDNYGCTSQIAAFIQDEGTIPVQIDGVLDICPNTNTTLSAGPLAFDTYAWSNGDTSADIVVDMPGDYTVTVTSGTCTGTATVTVEQYNAPTPIITGDLAVCNLSSTTIGVDGTYNSYLWSNGSSDPTITVTSTGTYSVTVTDNNGCIASTTADVTLEGIPLSILGNTDICDGEVAMLSASTQGAVTWSDASGAVVQTGASFEFTPPAIGSYTFIVDAQDNDCSAQETVTINVGAIPTVTASSDVTESCQGDAVNLSATTDVGTLSWAPANEFADPTLANQVVNPNGTTTYTATATSNGCSASDEVTITVSDAPTYALIDDTAICLGNSIEIGLIGAGDTEYAWTATPADPSLDADSPTPDVSPTETTEYILTATNGNCTEMDTVVVTVYDPTITVANDANGPVCQGEEVVLTANVSPAGGTITWRNPQGDEVGTGTPFPITANMSNTFTATYNIGGCFASASTSVEVEATPNLSITASNPDITIGDNTDIIVSGAPQGSSFAWSPDGGNTASINVAPLQTTTYTVTVTTPAGCEYVLSQIIDVTLIEFDMPNVLTPNGDEVNDGFYPAHSPGFHEIIEFKVFDRWGELVHEDHTTAWLGTHNNEDLPADVYVYFVKVRYTDGTVETRKGDVTLIR